MHKCDFQDLFDNGDSIGPYIIEGPLGCKTKNFVYKAFIPNSEKKYFVVKANQYQTPKNIYFFDIEQNLLEQLSNEPYILPIIDRFEHTVCVPHENEQGEKEDRDFRFICNVTEFCENLDLRDVYNNIIKKSPLRKNLKMKKEIFYQSLKILESLHSKNIVHHDIKPQNILVKNLDPIELILIDFEFAMQLGKQKIKRKCGTIFFMAPEILLDQEHDVSVDIWSLGFMMYIYYEKTFPFGITAKDDEKAIRDKIVANELTIKRRMPQSLKILLQSMLKKDPNERITATEALKSKFFNGIENLIIETKEIVAELTPVQTNMDIADQIEERAFDGNA